MNPKINVFTTKNNRFFPVINVTPPFLPNDHLLSLSTSWPYLKYSTFMSTCIHNSESEGYSPSMRRVEERCTLPYVNPVNLLHRNQCFRRTLRVRHFFEALQPSAIIRKASTTPRTLETPQHRYPVFHDVFLFSIIITTSLCLTCCPRRVA